MHIRIGFKQSHIYDELFHSGGHKFRQRLPRCRSSPLALAWPQGQHPARGGHDTTYDFRPLSRLRQKMKFTICTPCRPFTGLSEPHSCLWPQAIIIASFQVLSVALNLDLHRQWLLVRAQCSSTGTYTRGELARTSTTPPTDRHHRFQHPFASQLFTRDAETTHYLKPGCPR